MANSHTLSDKQKVLADAMLSTKTQAKVHRRFQNDDGSYRFEYVVRDTSPVDFPVHPGEFAIKVHDTDPGAPLAPIYINLRSLPEDILEKIACVLDDVPQKARPDFCTGIPNAAEVIAEAYAKASDVPYIKLMDKIEQENSRVVVPHPAAKKGNGESVVIIDDVISHANSKIEAIKAVESLGYKIAGILVLIDRLQGGKEKIEQAGYNVYCAFDVGSLLTYYVESGKIPEEKYKVIKEYFKLD